MQRSASTQQRAPSRRRSAALRGRSGTQQALRGRAALKGAQGRSPGAQGRSGAQQAYRGCAALRLLAGALGPCDEQGALRLPGAVLRSGGAQAPSRHPGAVQRALREPSRRTAGTLQVLRGRSGPRRAPRGRAALNRRSGAGTQQTARHVGGAQGTCSAQGALTSPRALITLLASAQGGHSGAQEALRGNAAPRRRSGALQASSQRPWGALRCQAGAQGVCCSEEALRKGLCYAPQKAPSRP